MEVINVTGRNLTRLITPLAAAALVVGVGTAAMARFGVDNSLWSDHSSIQPTMMVLLRLHDDYLPDGRVLGELIEPSALPGAMRPHSTLLRRLGALYTQLEAPVGEFGLLYVASFDEGAGEQLTAR